MVTLPTETDQQLADFLLENGVVDAASHNAAALEGKGIVNHLLSHKKVTEEAIADKIAAFYRLQRSSAQAGALASRPLQEVITDDFIEQSRILPVRATETGITILLADTQAFSGISELKSMTGLAVTAEVVTLSEMEKIIRAIKNASDMPMGYQKPEGEEAPRNRMPESGSDVIDFVNNVIADAVLMGVSDIHLEIFREAARVRYRLHGVLQEQDDFNEFLTFNYSAVTTRIKIMSNLDISERRLPQDGAITFDTGDKHVDIRVSCLPNVHGERIVMRILDPAAANFTLEELGLSEADLASFRKAIHSPQGMILVTGPTGSGKSTSLYAVLKEVNQVGTNVLTAEDPVEYELYGVGQVQIKDSIGLTFSSALRSFLRQDPEVIMVGEIRDKETSDIAMKAALTGHLVLSTLHTNDAPSTITRLINMGIPNYLISSALILVVAQRLARVICQHCKEADESYNRDKLLLLGFDEEESKKLVTYRGMGCQTCMGTGVKGRRAIHEILSITPQLREAILRGLSESEMRDIARKSGFNTMQETGRRLIREGHITVAEFQRILMLE